MGGSFLSLYYPGTWNEGLSSGQGLMAIALVIFARWHPVHCFWVALLFGGATALGPALQSVVIGTTLGMMLANVPIVIYGERIVKRLPLRVVRWLAAGVFFGLGAMVLLEGIG